MSVGETQTLTATVSPSNATNKTVTWSSSNTSVATVSSSGVVSAKAAGSATITVKTNDGNKTATCKVTVTTATIAVTSVSLNKSSLSMTVGETQTLTATVLPTNATNKTVTWSSSNTSVATVSSSGTVTAKTAGSATITVTTNDGGKFATCSITVTSPSTNMENGHEWVDLGLPSGLKWATCNVGANAPEEYGDYFAWGEVEPYYSTQNPLTWRTGKSAGYDWNSYRWCNGSMTSLTKYNDSTSYGPIVDNINTLELEDDAAREKWQGQWRMPKKAEFDELKDNCTWTWSSWGGHNGYTGTGKNGNIIFLPAAGHCAGTQLYGNGSEGFYWSSSHYHLTSPCSALALSITSSGVGAGSTYFYSSGRCDGLSVRPVFGDALTIAVTGVSLNKGSITLMVGETETLTATVQPTNATNNAVTWSSSNTSVATVSSSGVVTAKAAGSATITVKTNDGNKTATCQLTVKSSSTGSENGHEWVDLGLPSGLKWATCNVGASSPEAYGDYYAWGETAPYYTAGHSQDNPCNYWKSGKSEGYDWQSYKWCNGSSSAITKYCTSSSYGIIDNKTVLDPEDDAAYVNWGGTWRMPTDAEWTELRTKCSWTWTSQNGVNGRLVTGPNDKSIFLPAAGDRGGDYLGDAGSDGYYWSSFLGTGYSDVAWGVYFNSDYVCTYGDVRCYGFSVRPVL